MKNLRRILLVSGGRDNVDLKLIITTLEQWKPDLIIHGGARGTDTIAANWARKKGVAATCIPVPEEDYERFRGNAPKMRNTTMVNHVLDAYCWNDNGIWRPKPTYWVEGMFFPGQEGTADCKQKWVETGLMGVTISIQGSTRWWRNEHR